MVLVLGYYIQKYIYLNTDSFYTFHCWYQATFIERVSGGVRVGGGIVANGIDQPCFQVDDSDVRYICTSIMRQHVNIGINSHSEEELVAARGGDERLEMEMLPSEQELFITKYRKKNKSGKKGQKNKSDGGGGAGSSSGLLLLPPGGAIRPLRVEIVNQMSEQMSIIGSGCKSDDRNKDVSNDNAFQTFLPILDDIISRFDRLLTLISIFNIVYFTLNIFSFRHFCKPWNTHCTGKK